MEQHFVPQFYLRRFADPRVPATQGPQVWVADLVRLTVTRRSVRRVAARADYYAIQLDDGTFDQAMEEVLGAFETAAAPAITRILNGCFNLGEQQRAHLAIFMAFLVTRVPLMRTFIEHYCSERLKKAMRVAAVVPGYFERLLHERSEADDETPEDLEDARRMAMDESSCTVVVPPLVSLRLGIKLAKALAPRLASMRWEFLRAAGTACFLTGDNPVSWATPGSGSQFGAGLDQPGVVVTFPLSPTMCLSATWMGGSGPRPVVDDVVESTNRLLARFAAGELYSKDRALAQQVLIVRKEMKDAGERIGAPPFTMMILG
ncbi:MAG TPA: DUF4238 domain-containing protein [Candidatus Acidoferrum sp.]|nr:DUF4238 domain-containing protein [Candidatus Acidoferrum sp.]